jgi:hypothetical protein
MSAPATAISQEVIWKNGELMTFAVSLIEAALAKLRLGATEFTTDIVQESSRGTGKGIPGSVVSMLQSAHVLAPVGASVDGVWYALRIKSIRPGAKARYLGVYRLTGRELAESFLARALPGQPATHNDQPTQ